jgi:hypothetical protein
MADDTLDDARPGRPTPSPVPRTRGSILIVEPDARVGRKLRAACVETGVDTVLCPDFQGGRDELERRPPHLLVTNLRLEAYNGLHLVLLSQMTVVGPRCVVHTDRPDYLLVREALAMGAFFERTDRLIYSLVGYMWGELPPEERRDPQRVDRRATFRGGRRASDNLDLAS